MHFRRVLPVLRPVVVITPNPEGGRNRKTGSVSALTTRPSRAVRIRRVCLGASAAAASRTRALSLLSVAPITSQDSSAHGGLGRHARRDRRARFSFRVNAEALAVWVLS